MKVKKISHSASDNRFEVILLVALCTLGVIVAYPLIYVLSSSFSSPSAVMSGKVWLWPVEFGFEGYKAIFKNSQVLIG